MKNVVAIIPARAGSKTIKDKNIRIMNGKPMIAYSIEHALKSNLIDRVIVSTDSENYKEIAEKYGAEVPFLRPKEYAQDHSLDIDVFKHALEWMRQNGQEIPEYCVHLRPTHPVRDISDIDEMIKLIQSDTTIDSVRSVSPAEQTPYKMWLFHEKQRMTPVAGCSIEEAYNAPRQKLPEVYMQNACIDIVRSDVILKKSSMTGSHIYGYKMAYDFDIDTEEDFLKTEQYLMLQETISQNKKLTICCDIDGVIATKTLNNNYHEALPISWNIDILNRLYEKGHRIILFTARGYITGIDWEETTQMQLKRWGIKYTELKFGKPAADVYIDDRFIMLNTLKIL